MTRNLKPTAAPNSFAASVGAEAAQWWGTPIPRGPPLSLIRAHPNGKGLSSHHCQPLHVPQQPPGHPEHEPPPRTARP